MLEQVSIRKSEISQKLIKFSSDRESQDKVIEEFESDLKDVSMQIIELSKRVMRLLII